MCEASRIYKDMSDPNFHKLISRFMMDDDQKKSLDYMEKHVQNELVNVLNTDFIVLAIKKLLPKAEVIVLIDKVIASYEQKALEVYREETFGRVVNIMMPSEEAFLEELRSSLASVRLELIKLYGAE